MLAPVVPPPLFQAARALAAQPAAGADSALRIDSVRGPALDSVNIRSPLPGGVATVSRWLFGLPQWVQIGAVLLGVAVALALLVLAWRRRRELRAWLASRSTAWKIAYATVVGAFVVMAAAGGAAGWHYTQHDNDFCSSCHVMVPAFQRFRTSEHRKLSCHACHQQSIFASVRQVYYWVAERPMEIPEHAKVPTRICAQCHIQRDADSTWKAIDATAGHRLHLHSDSSALKGKVECVTCHGREIHRFVPVSETCGQSGCHQQKDTRIKLGKMASQTSMHCGGCHQFTRDIPTTMTVDSARAALTPGHQECLACHQMRTKLADLDPRREPHGAVCGSCHNPHMQETPKAAFESCTAAGCHAGADTLTPMHRGLPASTLASCGRCHEAHEWRVKAGACIDCHRDIPGPRTSGAPHRTAAVTMPGEIRLASTGPLTDIAGVLAPARTQQPPQQRTEQGTSARGGRPPKFSHAIHRDVACTSCHASERRHGETLVRTARDCASCHHRADRAAGCTGCHAGREPAPPEQVKVAMTLAATAPARERTLTFSHVPHRDVACRDCHTTPVTLAVTRTCASCHAEHHVPEASCIACHAGKVQAAHRVDAHEGCSASGCHASAVAAALPPTRNVCLVCHQQQVQHRPGRECADCHRVTWVAAAERRP